MKGLILTRVEKRNALLMALLVLFSNPMWFTWNYRFFYILFFSSLFFLSLVLQKGIKEKASLFTLLIGLLFLSYFGIISTLIGGFQTYVFISAILLFVWPIIKDKEKIKALDYLTTFLSFILGISFVFWFVHTFLFSLPSFGSISYYESKGMNVEIDNFLVFIQVKHDFIIRFYSIFDEPGTIGTLVAFILYGNQYNFKDKRNLVLLIATIFTFSLAFYILFVIGLAIQKIKSIKQFLLYSLSLTTIIVLLLMFLGENPTFQTVILGRFENLDSSLNSRETHYLDNYYEHFLAGPDFLWGRGRSFFLDNAWLFSGQTYKFFIIEFGLLGTFILGISYLSLIKKWNMYSVGLLLIFVLSFIQRPFALLIWQILLFIILLGRSSILSKKDYGRGI